MASSSASSKSLVEDMLSSDVDESAINAIVGSLESQLSNDSFTHENKVSLNSNHINNPTGFQRVLDGQAVNTTENSNSSSKKIIITPQNNTINKNLIVAGTQQTLLTNHHNTALTSSAQQTPSSSTSLLTTLSGALPASGYLSQVTNSPQPVVNALSGNVLQTSGASLKLTPTGITNGSANSQPNSNRLLAGSNLSVSAINPQHPQLVITSTSQTSTGTACASNVLNKSQQQTINVTNKPNALLLTTSKGGPTAMVVQTGPVNTNSSHNVNCETTTTSVNNNHAISTTAAVFALSKPVATASSQPQQQQQQTQQQQQQQHHQQQQILTQVVSNPNTILPAGVVLNVNPSRPVGSASAIPGQASPANIHRNLAPRSLVLGGGGPVRIAPQLITGTRPNAPSVQIGQQTITLPPNLRGTLLVKTENGQLQLVNVAHPLPQTSTGNSLPATYRLQVPVTAATTGQHSATTSTLRPQQMTVSLPASVASAIQRGGQPVQVTQPLTIQTTTANAQAAAATPSQMSPNTAKKKCKNFLSTLIKLASDQPDHVATNVKNLIQGLIDGVIQPEDFTNQLQRELNSSPQPCLVPFLKKSLPYLRHSLMMREMTIDGVRPPTHGSVSLPPQPQAIPQIQIAHSARAGAPGATVRFLTTIAQLAQGTTVPNTIRHTQPATVPISVTTPLSSGTPTFLASKVPSTPSSASKTKSVVTKARSPATSKEREKKAAFSSSLRDDDDINDVAAMGGVNLVEESQRILATNAEFVGAQIRSCKDENFLFTNPLESCINQIATKFGLEEVSSEIVSLVSHAAQERLKTLVEKLGIIAEHRIENIKMDPRYEPTQDVRSQVKFLEELDRIEKRKHEEQEREMLLRAAKSRSKLEDPEQLKLKQKAKEMQRAELEEARQREANETALLAIGPRKKMKLGSNNATSVNPNNAFSSSTSNHINSSPFSTTNKSQMRRVKRVNIRDLQFLMEQERETVRTPMLYRAYAK